MHASSAPPDMMYSFVSYVESEEIDNESKLSYLAGIHRCNLLRKFALYGYRNCINVVQHSKKKNNMSNSHDLSSLFFLRSSCTYSSSSSSYPLHPFLIPLPSSSYRTRVFVYASSSSDVRKRFLRVHYKTMVAQSGENCV